MLYSRHSFEAFKSSFDRKEETCRCVLQSQPLCHKAEFEGGGYCVPNSWSHTAIQRQNDSGSVKEVSCTVILDVWEKWEDVWEKWGEETKHNKRAREFPYGMGGNRMSEVEEIGNSRQMVMVTGYSISKPRLVISPVVCRKGKDTSTKNRAGWNGFFQLWRPPL